MKALGPWIVHLNKKTINNGDTDADVTIVGSDMRPILPDYIQEGEQGMINGRKPEKWLLA